MGYTQILDLLFCLHGWCRPGSACRGQFSGEIYPTIGASGAVFGLLLAFGMMYPNSRIMLLFPPIPLKAKWFVIVYGLLTLVFGVTGTMPGIAHFAHLGGMLFGLGLILYWASQARTGR